MLPQVTEHGGCSLHNFRRVVRRKQLVGFRQQALYAAMRGVAFAFELPKRSVCHNGSNSVVSGA